MDIVLKALFFLFIFPQFLVGWGARAHRDINLRACGKNYFPQENFFTQNATQIADSANDADKRKKWKQNEGPRHFLNTEDFPFPPEELLKFSYSELKNHLGYTRFNRLGTLPWAITETRRKLLNALLQKNQSLAINLAGDLGHYVADLTQPLHCTTHFDGPDKAYKGIHAAFESELYPKMSHKIAWPLFVQSYVGLGEKEFTSTVESGLTLTQLIFKGDHLARLKDPARGGAYFRLFEEKVGKILEGRIQLGVELLSNQYFSVWTDYQRALSQRGKNQNN